MCEKTFDNNTCALQNKYTKNELKYRTSTQKMNKVKVDNRLVGDY